MFYSRHPLNDQWYKDGAPISGAVSATYQATVSGSYTVNATNNGITSPFSAAKIVTASTIPAKPTITRNGTDLVSSSATGNQWYREEVLISGATGQSYKPADAANYTVIVTNGACAGPESDKYYFLITGVITIDNTHFIRLTPNPVSSQAQLSFNIQGISTLSVQLADMQGRMINMGSRLSTGSTLNMSGLAAGMYTVVIYAGKQEYTMKLLKQ